MKVDGLRAESFTIPTSQPESDGTLAWSNTTLVVVECFCEGVKGTGYTYAHSCLVSLIEGQLREVIIGQSPMQVSFLYHKMRTRLRNLGQQGLTAMAISAIDMALWDLKCRLLGRSFLDVAGRVREGVDVYGSGGFTSASDEDLQREFSDWVDRGIKMVKMKVGREPESDFHRVSVARETIGEDVELFVDANGAYSYKEALAWADIFGLEFGVTWFEEPLSSDDLKGLSRMRYAVPAGLNITAGEYGFDRVYFKNMLAAGAVDILQADATRCGGVSGYLEAATLCDAFSIPLSAHTAPHIHSYLCCVTQASRHLEYFHDHVRIESQCFDGFVEVVKGQLQPDPERSGFGFEFNFEKARAMASE